MSGPFADAELAEVLSRPSPVGPIDIAAMRAGIAERARARPRGPEMQAVRELPVDA